MNVLLTTNICRLWNHCMANCLFPPQIKYLQDFASKLDLNIEYETEIIDVSRVVAGFLLTDNRNNVHRCRVLIVRYIHVQLSSLSGVLSFGHVRVHVLHVHVCVHDCYDWQLRTKY